MMNNTNTIHKYQCHGCQSTFTSLQRLESHLMKKNQCQLSLNETSVKKIIKLRPIEHHICQQCHREFTRKDNLVTHLKKNRCPAMKNNFQSQTQTDLAEKMTILERELAEKNRQIDQLTKNCLPLE